LASLGKSDLDAFDNDGFIVDHPEYEEQSRKQAQKMKKRLYTS